MKARTAVFCLLFCFCSVNVFASQVLVENVPFKSQSPPGDWTKNMNCGPTSVVMLAGYYLGFVPDEQEVKNVLDWLYDNNYIYPQTNAEYYDGNATTAVQLKNILTGYYKLGEVKKNNDGDLQKLKANLQNDQPVIVGVNIQMDANKAGHFMVVIGLTETQVIVHDPGKTKGSFNAYNLDQFLSSWQTSNYVSLTTKFSSVTWHPDGTLIMNSSDSKVYILINGQLYWIVNEAVFNAHGFDWQKIIYVSQTELNCYPLVGEINWQPYREVFKVGNIYYLMEKQTKSSSGGAVYEFVSQLSFISWNLTQSIQELTQSQAQEKYFSKFNNGGLLYLRHGTVLQTDFGTLLYLVVDDKGDIYTFANEQTFLQMGYNKVPILLISESDLYKNFKDYAFEINEQTIMQCLNGSYEPSFYEEPVIIDNDNDGYSVEQGDCDDNNSNVNPSQPEVCDGIDNDCNGSLDENLLNSCGNCGPLPAEICNNIDDDCNGYTDDGVLNACGECGEVSLEVCNGVDDDCDGLIDEGVLNVCGNCGLLPVEICNDIDDDCNGYTDDGDLCLENELCEQGVCILIEEPVEPEPIKEPEDPIDPEPIEEPEIPPVIEELTEDEVVCSVSCPENYKAYIWYASFGEVSGQTAIMNSTKQEVCERGQPWLDFNCACLEPIEWYCFDPSLAVINCNHDFKIKDPGLIDYNGEAEIWFTDFNCF